MLSSKWLLVAVVVLLGVTAISARPRREGSRRNRDRDGQRPEGGVDRINPDEDGSAVPAEPLRDADAAENRGRRRGHKCDPTAEVSECADGYTCSYGPIPDRDGDNFYLCAGPGNTCQEREETGEEPQEERQPECEAEITLDQLSTTEYENIKPFCQEGSWVLLINCNCTGGRGHRGRGRGRHSRRPRTDQDDDDQATPQVSGLRRNMRKFQDQDAEQEGETGNQNNGRQTQPTGRNQEGTDEGNRGRRGRGQGLNV